MTKILLPLLILLTTLHGTNAAPPTLPPPPPLSVPSCWTATSLATINVAMGLPIEITTNKTTIDLFAEMLYQNYNIPRPKGYISALVLTINYGVAVYGYELNGCMTMPFPLPTTEPIVRS